MNKIDFIGDIHGHADELIALLGKLGYSQEKGWFQHDERKVIFVGDYIDRGPKVRETLQIVKNMVDNGTALALMGNHEYNAIMFNTPAEQGGYLRPHSIKNFKQHAETLMQFQNRQAEYDHYIDWFRTLPVFIETETFRAVHATWSQQEMEVLKTAIENKAPYFPANDAAINQALEISLKGKETSLPEGSHFVDTDGNYRKAMRVKWWVNTANKSYRELSFLDDLEIGDIPYLPKDKEYYHESEKPVFFGHYWLKGKPKLQRGNICCLDFSVAKSGCLACYRFDGEQTLDNRKFVYV